MSQREKTMNCEDIKQAFAADPRFHDESGHVEGCASCQAFASDMAALDLKLVKAMEINVPELQMPDLPDVDVSNVASLPVRRELPKMTWFAVAATVALAVFVGFQVSTPNTSGLSLEQQVLAHLDHEPFALVVSSTPISDRRLAAKVPDSIATMNHDAGLITYAQSCEINGHPVPHLVIQGAKGPVTILLMPDEMVNEATSFEGENTKGVILPVGNGSIAIIGARDEELDNIKQNVMNSVNWST